jgi:hypothetical protein
MRQGRFDDTLSIQMEMYNECYAPPRRRIESDSTPIACRDHLNTHIRESIAVFD